MYKTCYLSLYPIEYSQLWIGFFDGSKSYITPTVEGYNFPIEKTGWKNVLAIEKEYVHNGPT